MTRRSEAWTLRGRSRRCRRTTTCPTTGCASRSRARTSLEIDDPYRYGRVLTDFDLHLFGEGTHYRAFEKLGAHRITVGLDRPACTSRCGRRTPIASASSATSTAGTAACIRCGCSRRPASGNCSSPTCRTARSTSSRFARRPAHLLKKTDPFGVAFEVPPQTASIVRDISRLRVERRRLDGGARRARRVARSADVDLRSAPRLVGARAGGRQPVPHLPRAGAPAACRT